MATTTPKLGLRKPAGTDTVNVVTDIATNMQAIEDQLPAHKQVRKAADETVNNSAVLQNDDELLFAVGANEVWVFDLVVWFDSPTATPGLKFAVTVPAGAAGYFMSADGPSRYSFGTTQSSAGLSAISRLFKGIIRNGATPGNLQFQWAQNAATAENSKVLLDSYLIAHRIA